jgi:hypothetical protein
VYMHTYIHREACAYVTACVAHMACIHIREEYQGDTGEVEGVTCVRAARWRSWGLSSHGPIQRINCSAKISQYSCNCGYIQHLFFKHSDMPSLRADFLHQQASTPMSKHHRVIVPNTQTLTIFDTRLGARSLTNLCIQAVAKCAESMYKVYNYCGSPSMRCLSHPIANAVYAETQLVPDPTTNITGTHSRHAQSSSQSLSPDWSRRSRS